ncbi:hypothetical protein JOF53_002937 [Crossiella equi]|uniref:Gram-positive cocci surface proteins LPxTG domain-containing protein n=1 Tax=Crossiella equi TaxID=130796 RepID=A0ABS5ABU8_9PSEU|nr:hypothetical protein [Crossiella equi]MBP2474065.1 hypothetical protein [Crossiella equi]
MPSHTRSVTVAAAVTALLVGPGLALAHADTVDEQTGPLAHALVLAGQGSSVSPALLVSKLLRSPLSPGDTVDASDRISLPEGQTTGRFQLGAGTAAAYDGKPPQGVTAGQARYRAESTLRTTLVPSAKVTGDLGLTATGLGQLVYLQNVTSEATCAAPDKLTANTGADALWLRHATSPYPGGELKKVNLPAGTDVVTSTAVHTGSAGETKDVVSDIAVRRVKDLTDLVAEKPVTNRGVATVAGWRVDVTDYERTADGNKGAKIGENTFVLGATLCTTAKDFTPKAEPTTSTPTVPVKIPAGPVDNPAANPAPGPDTPTADPALAADTTGTTALPAALLGLTLLGAAATTVVLRRRTLAPARRRTGRN